MWEQSGSQILSEASGHIKKSLFNVLDCVRVCSVHWDVHMH